MQNCIPINRKDKDPLIGDYQTNQDGGGNGQEKYFWNQDN